MRKLEQLEETLAEYDERVASLEAVIAECDVLEAKARADAIREDPTKRSDAGGARSPIGAIQKRKRDRERDLRGLLKERESLRVVIGEERQRVADEALQREIKKARGFRLRELDDLKRVTAAFEALAAAWATWAEHMTEADIHAHSVDHGGLLAGAPHLIDEWLTAVSPVNQPVPLDFMSMIEKLREAAADPYGVGTREQGGIRRAGVVLPTLVDELPYLNKRLAVQGANHLSGSFDRVSYYDRVKPNENYFEATSSAVSEAAAEIAAEALA